MWRYYYRPNDGQLVSEAENGPDALPGLHVLERAQRADLTAEMWDATTRSFIARPLKVLVDRVQDIVTHPDYSDMQMVWSSLSSTQRTRLRDTLIRLLGRARWRSASQPVEVEPST